MNNLVIVGTRPEEIKLYPLSKYKGFDFVWVNQSPDLKQNLITYNWEISESELRSFIQQCDHDRVVVQGDTRTTFRGAVYGFENSKEIVHIEAGLRTWDLHCPFPEEGYRRMIDCISKYKFCSTHRAVKNCGGVYVGQTSIDTLYEFVTVPIVKGRTWIITIHRNESDMEYIRSFIINHKRKTKDNYMIIAHPNKQGQLLKKNFKTVDPVPYQKFVNLLAMCKGIITDSGGLQEESVALGKECIVLRKKSERGFGEEYKPGATKKIVDILRGRNKNVNVQVH